MTRRGPFPGMDPWLESRWAHIHHSLVGLASDSLNDQLPDDLLARIDERVYVGYTDGESRHILPDVAVLQTEGFPRTGGGGLAMATVDEPVMLSLKDELPTEGYIEIVEARDESKIITAIEVLSPTNKLQSGPRREYRQKRREYHHAGVSVVEIDLLRCGKHLIDVPKDKIPERIRTPYKVCVRRSWSRNERAVEYYPIPLRSRLPRIRIPLRPTDPDAALDLQALLDNAYIRGRYDRTDYSRLLDPPLSDDDFSWAMDQVNVWKAG